MNVVNNARNGKMLAVKQSEPVNGTWNNSRERAYAAKAPLQPKNEMTGLRYKDKI